MHSLNFFFWAKFFGYIIFKILIILAKTSQEKVAEANIKTTTEQDSSSVSASSMKEN